MKRGKGLHYFGLLFLCIAMCFLAGRDCHASEKEQHSLWFFFENVCASCNKEEEFYDLFNRCVTPQEKEELSYEIRVYNIFLDANREIYEKLLAENGKTLADYELPVLVVDGQWLSGYEEMEEELHGILMGESVPITDPAGAGEKEADQSEAEGSAEDQSGAARQPEAEEGQADAVGQPETEKGVADSPKTAGAETLELPDLTEIQDGEPAILFFDTYACQDCEEVKEYLTELQETVPFAIAKESVVEGDNIQVFKKLLQVYGRSQEEGKVPAVFVGNQAFLGKEEIKDGLEGFLAEEDVSGETLKAKIAEITKEAAKNQEEIASETNRDGTAEEGAKAQEEVPEEAAKSQEEDSLNYTTLFGAGLLAGFNPCSISMLLMLFSILLTSRASVLKNGLLYLIGKYVTYLALGLGLSLAAARIDEALLGKYERIVTLVIIVLFLAAAVLNFMDFLNVRKEEYGKIRMQLPKGLRRFNHKLLKKTEHMEGALLGILVLGLGIAISIGEFFCSGQIYMASILYLLRDGTGRFLEVLGALLVYVTAMSIPAVAVMAVIYKTKSTSRVSDFMLKHMGAIKLLNAVLFLFYAIWFVVRLL